MIQFDQNFDPPALVLTATLTGVVNARPRVRAQALIDTGADLTAVPAALRNRLHLYPFGRLQIEDVHGIKTPGYTYRVRLTIDRFTPQIREVVLTRHDFVILGRDWLEAYYLLLNGPEQNFVLSATPIVEPR